ncbi:MAG: hypothetical protein KA187_01645, partial [Arenimonas sp.]|nr:hypothetical protein [Arenimonas sp.]
MGKAGGRWFRAAVTALVCAACVGLAGCSAPPPETALRDTIVRMQAAGEARDASRLVESVSEEFVGPDGMDRDQFRRFAAVVWL